MLFKILILFLGLNTAYALRCYSCLPTDSKSCSTVECDARIFDVCFSNEVEGHVIKGCFNSVGCNSPISCCKGDLCNGFIPTGPSVILLLLTSAIFTLFV